MIKAAVAPAEPRLEAVLERMRRLHPKVIDLSLGRIERLLAKLGNPERRLPPVAHVAGTNGKGSTVAFLRAMAEAAGYKVHVYTSPHLVHFHERIRLAGSLIGDPALAELLEEIERLNGDDPITFFEITTAAAFQAFAQVPADLTLLEVGLGGRLDATNVIDRPAVSVLTRISMDHMQFLGGTIQEIAAEKAGILKPGAPAVAYPQADPAVTSVFRARAAELGAPLRLFGAPEGWHAEVTETGMRYSGGGRVLELPAPGLAGAHQVLNAGLAVAASEHLPVAIPNEAVMRGLAAVEWPARLQRLTRGPLADILPAGWELLLDGGHNDSAGEVLAAQAQRWADDGRPLDLVFGMLGSKRPLDFLGPLAPHVRRVAAVSIPDEPAALPAAEVAALARDAGIAAVEPAVSVEQAVRLLTYGADQPARILICGSLYLAGTVLRDNG
ncbi:bifunctional folylpolyglutamate synthase/dihydrofolate synthase [Indioceanicola profundi]|uniref:bifunctional folylpolyglutamate synthase/dihydrofolate synthase n=1 Tax=Indioceanicola profundi TaxID=2220096 RepID=UPI000E6A9B2B|nr:folylpolyglutamate synthase/dihydrofolate synthase family protein [Indioceanicola profundi]